MDVIKSGHKIHATISIDPAKWARFQTLSDTKLNLKASPHVERLIDAAIAQLEGKEPSVTLNLDDLRRQYYVLFENKEKVIKILTARGNFGALNSLLRDYDLDFHNYSNADKVIAKLLELIKGPPLKDVSYTKDDLDLLTDLLEFRKKLAEIKAKKINIKTKIYPPDN